MVLPLLQEESMRRPHPAWLAIALVLGSHALASAQTSLARRLEMEAARLPARTAVYVKHLGTGEAASVRAAERFNSMSVIKIPIMVRAFLLAEQGRLSLGERVTLTRAELRDGTGVLQYHDAGLQPTVRDLITEMIITSDNTATDLVTLKVGGVAELNRWLAEAGYPDMRMVGRGFEYRRRLLALLDPALRDITPEETTGLMHASSGNPLFALYGSLFAGERRKWVDVVTDPDNRRRMAAERRTRTSGDPDFWLGDMTVRDIGRMLEGIERETIASPASCREMKVILRRQQLGVRRLPHFIDVPVGHKTGDQSPGIANDVGIIYARSGPIVMAVFTRDNTAPYGEMEDRIGELARGVVQHFDGTSAAQPAASRSPEQELEDLERRLVAAIGSKDLVTYDQLVADDYVVLGANGTERTKADVIAGYRAGAQGYRGLEISEVKGHVFGDTGIVTARTLGFRVDGGKETPNRVRYVRVFARRNGRWQAVAQMAQPLPPDQQ
jgi:beta-lactamase class A/ketosteroid isomerase-like protein